MIAESRPRRGEKGEDESYQPFCHRCESPNTAVVAKYNIAM